MGDRDNRELNEVIESHIRQWDGTIHGYCVKNAWENGTDYEAMCEMIGINYEDFQDM